MTTIAPYPLQWPVHRPRTKPSVRRSGRFNRKERVQSGEHSFLHTKDLSIAEALKRLQEELDRINARMAVVSSNLETRLDGLPRSNQRKPDDPGVAVYFQLGKEPHCLPCDTYDSVAANIAAVAAHIAATRAIERHGVATVREMFSGFAQLPAPGFNWWWDVLQCRPDASRETIDANFRRLARDRHPDNGGATGAMAELNAARDLALKGMK
jgi:hypothetical protein